MAEAKAAATLPPEFVGDVALVAARPMVGAHCRVCLKREDAIKATLARSVRPRPGMPVQRTYEMLCSQCGRVVEVKWQFVLQLGVLHEGEIHGVLVYDQAAHKLLGISAAEFAHIDDRGYAKLNAELYPTIMALTTALLLSHTFHFKLAPQRTDRLGRNKDPVAASVAPVDPGWVNLRDYLDDQRKRKHVADTEDA